IRDDLVTGVQTCALPISMVRPYGSPSYAEVTTVTPVGKWPSTCRKRLESKSAIGRRLRRAEADVLALRRRRDREPAAVGERLAEIGRAAGRDRGVDQMGG